MDNKRLRAVNVVKYYNSQLRKYLRAIENEEEFVDLSLSNLFIDAVYTSFTIKNGLAVLESYVGDTSEIVTLKIEHYQSSQRLIHYMEQNTNMLWNELERLLSKYENEVMNLSNLEYEEFMNVINIRNSMETFFHYFNGIRNLSTLRKRIDKTDSILRNHENRKWLKPFSKEEQLRLLLPKSHWWYFSDL